jgi:predicted glycoside hydrolase/deacetylase ChbG (UPF0249 family)
VRTLIVNADDFGFTPDVNRGIIDAHRDGILTSTTLMACGAAFDDAVRLAKENPTLDVGCHLVLVGEPPYPQTLAKLLAAVAFRRIRLYEEFRNQVRRILDAGLTPTHLDTHKHTHLLPPVLDAVARVSEEFGIRWVRHTLVLRGHFDRVLRKHHARATDHFTGFQVTGKFDAAILAKMIRELPEGSTEFMCHPGRCGPELLAAGTRLKESRERELQALTSPEVRAAVTQSGVRLATFGELK